MQPSHHTCWAVGMTGKVVAANAQNEAGESEFFASTFQIALSNTGATVNIKASNLRRRDSLQAGDVVEIHSLQTRGVEHNGIHRANGLLGMLVMV